MAGAGGKSVGRVSIRVVPDSSRFREDLNKSLSRIEKVAKLTVRVGANTTDARNAIKDVKDYGDKQNVTLNVDADTGKARASILLLTRVREVKIRANMDTSSFAKVSAALAGLSGSRVLTTYLDRAKESLLNLDKSVPRIATVTLALWALGASAISASGGIFTVGAGLAQAATAALALPGILGGAAVGAVVLAVALKGANDYIGDLADGWKDLAPVIRDNFWGVAEASIRNLSGTLLPTLRTELGQTATALGEWTASLADGFSASFTPDVFAKMFANLNESIRIASTATSQFASILAGLGQVGASYLPRLATWVAGLTTRFDAFLSDAINTGDIFSWIDAGITALQQIGSVLGSVAGILAGINSAAQAAGGGGLATLATAMEQVNVAVNSPAFQGALTTIFEGAAAGVAGLATALGPIGSMFAALAPAISSALSTIGSTVGTLLSGIADALADPAVSEGLTAMISGLASGVEALVPALGPLAQALGSVMKFVGPLAAAIGGVLATAVTALAPVVTTLLTAIQPLVPILSQALVQAITMLTPLITMIVGLIAQMIPTILPLIEQILPVLVSHFQKIIPVVMEIISTVLPPLVQVISTLVSIILGLVEAFLPLVQSALPLLVTLANAVAPILQLLGGVLGVIAPIVTGVASAISSVLSPAISGLTEILNGIITFITGVFTGNWTSAWDAIVGIVTGIWNTISGTIKGAINGLIDIINGMIGGVNGITGTIGIAAIPLIPKLALGAVVSATPGGTTATIGEGKYDEAVLPLGGPQFARLADAIGKRVGSTGSAAPAASSGANVQVDVHSAPGMSEEAIGQVAADKINFHLSLAGG